MIKLDYTGVDLLSSLVKKYVPLKTIVINNNIDIVMDIGSIVMSHTFNCAQAIVPF